MILFGVCFILYFLKLSNVFGFWGDLRRTDKEAHITDVLDFFLNKRFQHLNDNYMYTAERAPHL